MSLWNVNGGAPQTGTKPDIPEAIWIQAIAILSYGGWQRCIGHGIMLILSKGVSADSIHPGHIRD